MYLPLNNKKTTLNFAFHLIHISLNVMNALIEVAACYDIVFTEY